MRSRIAALAVVLLAAWGLDASPASAGAPASGSCFNGTGGIEAPLVTTPVTVGMEVWPAYNAVEICYASSPVGYSGSEIIGGRITIIQGNVGPAESVMVGCHSDSSTTVTSDCVGMVSVSPGGTVTVNLFFAELDTTVTSPVNLDGSGATVYSPLDFGGDLMLPCVAVNYRPLVPTCGTPLP